MFTKKQTIKFTFSCSIKLMPTCSCVVSTRIKSNEFPIKHLAESIYFVLFLSFYDVNHYYLYILLGRVCFPTL